MKSGKHVVTNRSPDAALGRETRSLIGSSKRSRATSSTGRTAVPLPALRGGAGKLGSRSAPVRLPGVRLPGVGRLITPARAAGLLGMLASGFLFSFVTGPSAFALRSTDVPELRWTSAEDVQAALSVPEGVNIFRLETAPLEAALEALPAIASAEVRVALPDAVLAVAIQEREAILAWEAGDTRFLADREGVIFAAVDKDAELPDGVAVVEDRRVAALDALAIGATLDPVDLDVATRLGSLTPADVGSAASRLRVRVIDTDGFLVYVEKGWTAVFGFYSPATRQTSMIPGQVRLLRSFLATGEATVAKVILASETDGTYVPRATPRPTKP